MKNFWRWLKAWWRPAPTENARPENQEPAAKEPSPPPTAREVDVEVLPAIPASPDGQSGSLSSAPPKDAPPKAPPSRSTSAPSTALAGQYPSRLDLVAHPEPRSIDAILHSLLHERKWLSPTEREKLNRAYQMEKHRAGLAQCPDPTSPMSFRFYVPPPRPPEFHMMSLVNRMWYCRMEELWQFRQEDAAKAALDEKPMSLLQSSPPALPESKPRRPRKTKASAKRKSRRSS